MTLYNMDFISFSNVLSQLQDPFQGTNLELLLFFYLFVLKLQIHRKLQR